MKKLFSKTIYLLSAVSVFTAGIKTQAAPGGTKRANEPLQKIKYPSASPTRLSQGTQISFVENKGQITDQHHHKRNDIQYKLAAANGLNIFIGNGAIHYQFSKCENEGGTQRTRDRSPHNKPSFFFDKRLNKGSDPTYNMYRMDVSLVGANAHAKVVREQEQPYSEHYFTSNVSKGRATAHAFGRIIYKDVYPHIDWVFYTTRNKLKHEFVVHRGGRVSDIKLKYGGATALKLNNTGSLVATTPQGEITENTPYSYDERRKPVGSQFQLKGDMVSYNVDNYEGELVIDPTLIWATYYGGAGDDQPNSSATDSMGNVYITGQTTSLTNIATLGAYQDTFGGMDTSTYDAFLVKFDSLGTRQWATYYGGTGTEEAWSVAVDPAGNAYITGPTSSTTGIATSGAHQYSYGGGENDAFLAKFNTSGILQWGTYYGGAYNEMAFCLTTDALNNVYVAGTTNSPTSIATPGAFKTAITSTNTDVFLVKFNFAGVRQWGSYYGGTGNEYYSAVKTDDHGSVYLSGTTNSVSGIATAGASQATLGGTMDAFLVKFTNAGTRLWGTYFGGSSDEYPGYSLATDPAGNIFMTGTTYSYDGIATAGAYKTTHSVETSDDSADVYIAKFDSSGVKQWATYFGGPGSDWHWSIASNNDGNIFISGGTRSTSDIATPDAYQTTWGGGIFGDAFLVKFDGFGELLWGTYFGGANDDFGNSISTDRFGNVYLPGQTRNTSAIATPGAYQTVSNGGNYEGFLARFKDCPAPSAGTISGPSAVCAGSTITLTDTVSGGTWSTSAPGIATINSSGVVTGIGVGTAIISYTVSNTCGTTTATKTVTADATSAGSITGASSVCQSSTITLSNSATGGTWSVSDSTLANIDTAGIMTAVDQGTITVSYTVANSCGTATATKMITIYSDSYPYIDPCISVGQTVGLSGGYLVGTWTCSNTSVATIDASSGIVSGVAEGTALITYEGLGGCAETTGVVMVYNPCNVWGELASISAPIQLTGMKIDNAGTPYMVYTDYVSAIVHNVIVKKYNGSTWVDVGASLAGNGYASSMAIDATGLPYIVYTDDASGGKATVKKFNGSVWTTVGVAGFSSGVAGDPKIGLDKNGRPYVVYVDWANGMRATVKKYNGSSWLTVGSVGFTTDSAWLGGDIAIDSNDVPYTYFTDIHQGVSVYKFNGTSWTTIDTGMYGGVSLIWNPSMALDATGNLYMAYLKTGAGGNIIVKKYNGSSWDIIGDLAMGAAWVSIAVGSDGVPVMSFNHNTNDLRIMKYAGGSWIPIGCPGFFTIMTSVAFDGNNNPYVFYDGVTSKHVAKLNSSVSTIAGAAVICAGNSTTYSNTTGGGTWSSSNPFVANVDSTTGVVTGVAGGTAIISYNVSGCGTTAVITVNPLPIAGTITGASSMNVGNSIILADSISGGIWTSGATGIATVNSTGLVTGVSAGSATISYSVTNSCGTAVATKAITVNVSTVDITGTLTICAGSTTSLGSSITGGTWGSGTPTIATVSAAGVVTGLTAGTTTISYNTSGTIGTAIVTVNALPPSITGTAQACPGTTTTLSNTESGGTWSSSDPLVATVDTLTGVVTGIIAGTVNVVYTNLSGCTRSAIVTINMTPTIGGPSSTCVGTAATLTSTPAAISWSSSNTTAATISSAGIVTALTAGTTTISVTTATGCIAATVFTVGSATPIDGNLKTCVGGTTSLSNASTGGTWSSSVTGIASINASGVVTGVNAGTTTISYTLGAGCRSTAIVTVYANPTVAGTPIMCVGNSVALAGTPSGGTWISANSATATVSSTGIVTGVASGTVSIVYTALTGCSRTIIATVSVSPGSITGATSTCLNTTTTLSNSVAGGIWSSSNTSVASAGGGNGVITGLSVGTTTISYRIGVCSATVPFTIIAQPAAFTGTAKACVSGSTTLNSSTPGGTWTSSNTAVGTVDAGGIITGIAPGTTNIVYTAPTTCARSIVATINPNPNALTGSKSVCVGATTTLASTTPGLLSWTSSDATKATVNSTGIVTGVSAGTSTVTYTITSGCYTSSIVTVGATPAAITGSLTACTGKTTTLGSTTPGGNWSSGNPGVASIDFNGVVTGILAGPSVITYGFGGGCSRTATVNISQSPNPISGTPAVCVGATMYPYLTSVGSGAWGSSNTAIATVPATHGAVFGVAAGTATISFTALNGCAATKQVTVSVCPSRGMSSGTTDVTDLETANITLYPNPTKGSFSINTAESGTLIVSTIDGREIMKRSVNTGTTELALPPTIATGVYMCRFVGEAGATMNIRLVFEAE